MTVKEFFKSKTFRCIVVLLCIALVSGGLLSICNDLLSVSDGERVARIIKGIYGKEMEYVVVNVSAEYAPENDAHPGFVNDVYLLSDGNYLIKSTGYEGYKAGTVSIWCVAKYESGAFVGLENVSIADNDKQTLMSKFTSSVLAKYKGTKEYGDADKVSGATFSSRALHNAYNVALHYVEDVLEGGAQ